MTATTSALRALGHLTTASVGNAPPDTAAPVSVPNEITPDEAVDLVITRPLSVIGIVILTWIIIVSPAA